MSQSKKSLTQSQVKEPHQPTVFNSQHEVAEFMRCSDPVNGYKHFITNYFYIQHPTKGSIKFEPFDYQLELLHCYHSYKKSINMLGRQMGKSTTAAGYLLWYAMFVPDSTILVAAHKRAGSNEIMQRIRYAYETCPNFIKAGVTTYNKGSIEFDNGSRIVGTATTENTGRGMSISLLYCLDGDTTRVQVRNKHTLVEEELTLAELYGRISEAEYTLT